jgi:hypothetical protein
VGRHLVQRVLRQRDLLTGRLGARGVSRWRVLSRLVLAVVLFAVAALGVARTTAALIDTLAVPAVALGLLVAVPTVALGFVRVVAAVLGVVLRGVALVVAATVDAVGAAVAIVTVALPAVVAAVAAFPSWRAPTRVGGRRRSLRGGRRRV